MPTKQELREAWMQRPIEVGDLVYAKGHGSQNKSSWNCTGTVEKVLKEGYKIGYTVYPPEDVRPCPIYAGKDPFIKTERIENINFSLERVLYQLGIIGEKSEYTTKSGVKIKACNWNPFVKNKLGEKEYYQRGFVWSLEDNQTLIESIYQNIDCGKILIRCRSWEECEELGEEAAWKDIVDGKQRLNAIRGFINDEFADLHGNLYSELSDNAQRRLLNHQLFSYSELSENTKDEVVIKQFLRLNFCGVPQSREHIEFVKSINQKL